MNGRAIYFRSQAKQSMSKSLLAFYVRVRDITQNTQSGDLAPLYQEHNCGSGKLLNQNGARRIKHAVTQNLKQFPIRKQKKKIVTVAQICKCLLDGYTARHFSCKQCESIRHCIGICRRHFCVLTWIAVMCSRLYFMGGMQLANRVHSGVKHGSGHWHCRFSFLQRNATQRKWTTDNTNIVTSTYNIHLKKRTPKQLGNTKQHLIYASCTCFAILQYT